MRILGLDPGLRNTGWGVIDAAANRLAHVANGVVRSDVGASMDRRLLQLHEGIWEVLNRFQPDEAAIEETFVNKNPDSTLKLGLARGAIVVAPARAGLKVSEYAPNRVKKTVVGVGHANKEQVQMMVGRLLPGATVAGPDAADALAVAICHAHFAAARHDAGDGTAGETGMARAVRQALAREAGR
ncbi:MAG: crossover junction endodeoxyribonuclease RuvC [Pseudomonadota bacterium]|nr:crossover junction endodeoxyribonuclease RuvC [Pseudomonadota bacterium]MEC8027266.1 crossover junction endodeoxyribonuclease RuvC [Pseudomonadota bacterium]MEC8085174.1 crossover junction endodeoxyribonuclease RuvC [Pseudomonadota bacterium]